MFQTGSVSSLLALDSILFFKVLYGSTLVLGDSMSQVQQFLDSLKRTLKAKNIIYKDLAKILNLSESSIKRLLSDKSLSLERIEEICRACDISFAEICENAQFEKNFQSQFVTLEQEKVLAAEPRLLHYFILLNDGHTPNKIEKEYEISALEGKKYLLLLDKIKLIELYPRDRIKLKAPAEGLRFRREGAVGKILFAQTKKDYLNYNFDKETDFIRFTLLHTPTSLIPKLKKKFEKMIVEIQEDIKYYDIEKEVCVDLGLLTAFRPWEYTSLDVLKKKQK